MVSTCYRDSLTSLPEYSYRIDLIFKCFSINVVIDADSKSECMASNDSIVHLHSVAHRYFTFTFLIQSLCSLSMFKTLYSVLNTCHFLKSWKSLHVSAWIGHPQVLKVVFLRRLLLFYSVVLVRLFVSHRQSRKQRGTGTHKKQIDERAWLNKITAVFLKNNYKHLRMANSGRNM
jgi:hypothetical protein